MNKLFAVSIIVLAASVATVSSASAFAFSDELLQKIADLKAARTAKPASPGEPFIPNVEVADVREECDLAGGFAKRQFDDHGNLIWVCIL